MYIYCVDNTTFVVGNVTKMEYTYYVRQIDAERKIDFSNTEYKGYWDSDD